MTEPREINSQTIKGSWKEFELSPVVNDRTLEIGRQEPTCVLEGSSWGSVERRMEENKREVRELSEETVKHS